MSVILAVIPVYNEAESIEHLIRNYEYVVEKDLPHLSILIVNDGSTDRTVEVIQSYKGNIKLELIDNVTNGGLGKVIRQGLHQACESLSPDDIIITMDGDNSHLPDLIPAMVNKINDGYDIVIASRYRQGSQIHGLTAFRKLTGFLAGSLFIVFARLSGVRDYTCGYRAYRASILKKGFDHFESKFIEENGFACMAEILLKLRLFNPKYTEVPMILRYDLKLGTSKMNVLKTIKRTLKLIWQYRLTKRFK